MSGKMKRIAMGAAALTLAAVGLVGCSSSDKDVEACESLNEILSEDALWDGEADSVAELKEKAAKAAETAESPELAGDIEAFAASFDSVIGDAEATQEQFIEVAINTKNLLNACEAVGASVSGLQEAATVMGIDGFSVEELEDIRDHAAAFSEMEAAEEEAAEEEAEEREDVAPGEDLVIDDQNLEYDFDAMDAELAEEPTLTLAWSECFEGNMAGCDTLYETAPAGSVLKEWAADCGGFIVGNDGAGCAK